MNDALLVRRRQGPGDLLRDCQRFVDRNRPARNPLRKVREGVLTWQLEHALPKRRTLEHYLNLAEYGPGVYGAGAASQRYFGKPASELGPTEAAQLAAALPNPAGWHPGAESPAYRRRVASIRERMARAAFLTRLL